MIADFIERMILPHVSDAIDLHSGGVTLVHTPCGYVYGMGDKPFRAQKLAAAHAFGSPAPAVVMAPVDGLFEAHSGLNGTESRGDLAGTI